MNPCFTGVTLLCQGGDIGSCGQMGTSRGPKVQGLCPAGHRIETYAPARRVTWSGPCPHVEGGVACGQAVTARRIPGAPAPEALLEPPAPPARPGKTPIRKVARYRDAHIDPEQPTAPGYDQPPQPPAEPAGGDGGGGPGVPAPTAPAAAPGGPSGPRHDHPGGATGGPSRLRRFVERAMGPEFDDSASWTAPGSYR